MECRRIADFILSLIKINFGLAALTGIVLSILTIDHVKKHPLIAQKRHSTGLPLLLAPLALGIIYWAAA